MDLDRDFEWTERSLEEMLAFYERHQIKLVIDRVFKVKEAMEALQYLWSGRHFMEFVIKVSH